MKSHSTHQAPNSLYSLLHTHRWFFVPFLLFLATTAILLAIYPTGHWVLYFSERRSPFWDQFFMIGTRFGEEWAFIGVLLISLLWINYRHSLSIPILGIVVTSVSALTKKAYHHPRPLRYFREQGLEEQLNLVSGFHVNSGMTSFPSGHTMAAFALFTFFALNARHKKFVGLGLFLLALMVGISRIYLTQHFLKDIFWGSVLGLVLGILLHYAQAWLGKKAWLERRIIKKKRA